MENIFAYMVSILVLVVIFSFSKLREFYKERAIRDLVSWSVTGGDGIPLWSEISNAQNKLKLPMGYCIAGEDEWSYVKEIIEEYKKHLVLTYFKGHSCVIKSKYTIRGESYFMFTLYAFLSDHECDYEFLKHDMRKERIAYKSYGSGFGAAFDATFSLTEFALVFEKMHYITYMYCRQHEILKDFVPAWNEKNLKEILDTNQIQISRC